jgi:hypothetical protein
MGSAEPERRSRGVDQLGTGLEAVVAVLGERLAQHGVEPRVAGQRAGLILHVGPERSASVSRRYGGAPDRHSYSRQPSAQTSVRPSTGSPRICSGAR